jgi:hypothetical protein
MTRGPGGEDVWDGAGIGIIPPPLLAEDLMKRTVFLPVLAMTMLSACATKTAPSPVDLAPAPAATSPSTPPPPPKETPASALIDPSGTTPEAAVEVPKDAPGHGIDFQNNWIFDHYGRFRRTFGGVAQREGRRYDVVKVELWKDHSIQTIYFDITENWNAWTPEMH